jgi:hypothetical protein
MGYMPDVVYSIGIENKNIISSDIPLEQNIIDVLREI